MPLRKLASSSFRTALALHADSATPPPTSRHRGQLPSRSSGRWAPSDLERRALELELASAELQQQAGGCF
eukprot:1572180-Alexandrium_andersonii.AAC.1